MKKKVDQSVRDQEAAHLLEWMTKRGFAGNHASFAAKAGRTRAELSQHLKTERPIPLSAVKKYAEVLQCDVSDISPRWASELSPSSNTKKAPATTQLPDSPTQQDAVPEGAGMPHYQGNLYVIPIFRLEAFMYNKFDDEHREGEIPIPGNISKESFALRAEDDTLALASPSISKGMVVVFDPKAEIRHQAIVLAGEPGTRPVIRQLICDGHDLYLSAPQSGLPLRKIEHKAVLAVAVKAVIDLL